MNTASHSSAQGPPPHGGAALPERGAADVVLIVDDVPDNLSLLHDALDDSGYTVLVATHGAAALQLAAQAQPDIVLLDAMMPGLDGFEVARRLKADPGTASIPIVFMTGLTETEHVVAAFAAGGVDYVTKPIKPKEVLARIAAHMHSARAQRQARNALDAFGHATMVVRERDGRRVWQTALARTLMASHFGGDGNGMPAEVMAWIAREALRRRAGAEPSTLTVARGSRRVTFALHEVQSDFGGEGEWLVVLREADDAAMIEAMTLAFKLTAREAEVLYWVVKGKTNRDIGDILGTSPRTVHKHLEHVFTKLGVETRTAAASMALARVGALGVGR
jgi:CheY-like chemotaxis protein/DNA-binding CsgD family transcriptional regulator